MPRSLSTEAKDLRNELFSAQTLGKPIFTFDQLSTLIAGYVSNADPVLETNAADGQGRGSGVSSGGPCSCCGKPDHGWWKCKLVCGTCKLAFCPGRLQGKACVVHTADPVPDEVLNALPIPKQIPPGLHAQLVVANAKFNKRECASAEALSETPDDMPAPPEAAQRSACSASQDPIPSGVVFYS